MSLQACVSEHWVGLAVYVAVHLLTYYFFMVKMSRKHRKFNRDKEVRDKYGPFNRVDVDNWTLLNTLPGAMIFWPRMIMWLLNIVVFTLIFMMMTIDYDTKKGEVVSPSRRKMLMIFTSIQSYFACFLAGVIWFDVDYVSTGEGDYSKWLGPDWEPKWEKSGALIFNHTSFMDIIIGIKYFFPSFVSKASVNKYPFIRRMAPFTDSVFLERAGSKEEKIAAVKKIEERMKDNEVS